MAITSTVASEWNADSLVRSIPSRVTRSPGMFASYLETTFAIDEERVKALYIWLAKEINYDVKRTDSPIRFESMGELVDFTLRSKHGVCQGYAEVFKNICERMGIKAFTIHGYTKADDKIKTDQGHAWNAAKISGRWYLFDPTWGSGYVNGNRYCKSFSLDFYKAPPDSLIATHMPFDPLWQLKPYPVNHSEFLAGVKKGEEFFNYPDSLDLYFTQEKIERAEGSIRRAKKMNVEIRELNRLYRKFTSYISDIRSNYYIDIYNNAVHAMHAAVDYFNEYQSQLGIRNSDPKKLRELLSSSRNMAELAYREIIRIVPGSYVTSAEIRSFRGDITSLKKAIASELKHRQ
ncbi:MAG: hypothetical protein H8E51_09825 [Bacteroidetes bacterium]|nr:hypothetical protein [Bacteroidota bacterium]